MSGTNRPLDHQGPITTTVVKFLFREILLEYSGSSSVHLCLDIVCAVFPPCSIVNGPTPYLLKQSNVT